MSSGAPSPESGSERSTPVGSTPGSSGTEAHQDDITVVSTAPPHEIGAATAMLDPRQLGQALEGQQLDHVLLEKFVGGGGMGAVFRAWDTNLHRTVAVKVLSLRQASDSESQRRFQTEARSAARLDHPNIARAHYVGEDRGVPYIVFEYIDGTNLRDLVYSSGPLPLGDALNIALQISNALTHAWEREVVHRDIKPSNIILTPDGLAKLVDMGLARLEYLEQTEHDETATGVTLGTFDYISPEQARNPREADSRSDIYSLGCTLFFMLTSRAPFPEGTVLQKLLAHQNDSAPDVRTLRPDVPEILAAVLATMLAKRPEERFQTPLDLSAALTSCIEQLGLSLPAAALPSYIGSWSPPSRWWQRNAPWVIPFACLAIVVLILAIVWHRGVEEPVFPDLKSPQSLRSATPDKGQSSIQLNSSAASPSTR
ncbi:MAG TPA: serine/threonine-protein kinase [Lacipirellulaceae bacterium]|jgi:serine/threonine-protein kinase|nr:serine/threonine-protein kinase [Lacipirellulaceae bacterium]